MLLKGTIKSLKSSLFPAFALLCLGIGASCTRGTNESPDLANESPDLVSESADLANELLHPASESLDLALLESFLGNYYQRLHLEGDPPIRVAYDVAATDLNGDEVEEVLVYLRSDYFCGTNGCNLLILARHGEAFRVVTEISVAKPPIRVLDTRSHGWRSLAVRTSDWDILKPFEAGLAYNGESYPRNPSIFPARRLEGAAPGEILIHRRPREEADGEFVIGQRCIGASCARGTNGSSDRRRLESFLDAYYQDLHREGDAPVRVEYVTAATDLNGDDVDELLVYVSAEGLCGSSGCDLLILTRRGESFRVVNHMEIARPPIRVLDTRSNGWRNLTVTLHGGGILEPLEMELAFDGTSYPRNPSMPPARRMVRAASGEVLMDRNWQHESGGEFLIGEPR